MLGGEEAGVGVKSTGDRGGREGDRIQKCGERKRERAGKRGKIQKGNRFSRGG